MKRQEPMWKVCLQIAGIVLFLLVILALVILGWNWMFTTWHDSQPSH